MGPFLEGVSCRFLGFWDVATGAKGGSLSDVTRPTPALPISHPGDLEHGEK